MKPLILLILVALTITTAFGQKIRITDLTNKWRYGFNYNTGGAGNNNTLLWQYVYADTTTTLNGNAYRVLKISNASYQDSVIALIREDTATGTVWAKVLSDHLYENLQVHSHEEFLLMDYHLLTGDTLTIPLTYNNSGQVDEFTTSKHVVQSVDSVPINDVWHRQWNFLSVAGYFWPSANYFIEGIGADKNFFFHANQPVGRNWQRLVCFENQHTFPIDTGLCSLYPLAINSIAHTLDVLLYPNPSRGQLLLKTAGYDFPLTALVYDMAGRLLLNLQFRQLLNLDLHSFPKGTYLIQLAAESGESIYRKISLE